MSTTLYIRDILSGMPVSPLTALFLRDVDLLRREVNAQEIKREELVSTLSFLTQDSEMGEFLTYLLEVTDTESDIDDSDREAYLQALESVIKDEGSIEWDEVEARNGLVFNIDYAPTYSTPDLVDALVRWLKEDTVKTADQAHPFTDAIKVLLDSNFITDLGNVAGSTVSTCIESLNINGVTVSHHILEQDSYGPLICGIKTDKGMISYG